MSKEHLTTPSQIDYRAQILHNACKRIAEFRQGGVPIGRAVASEARKLNGTPLGGGRYLKLSSKSLRRHFDAWKRRKHPSVFALKYKLSERARFDPVLLQLVVYRCLQSGESLAQSVQALREQGARITIRDIHRVLNARSLAAFSQSQKRLRAIRGRLETNFVRAITRTNREFLKKQRLLNERMLLEDARLRKRLTRQRDLLQQKFFKADARAVKQRERLQHQAFKNLP